MNNARARVRFAALCVLIATMIPNGSAAAAAKAGQLRSSASTSVSNMLLQSLGDIEKLAREVKLQQTQIGLASCNEAIREFNDAAEDIEETCADVTEYAAANIDFGQGAELLQLDEILEDMSEPVERVCTLFNSGCGVAARNTVLASLSVLEECDGGFLPDGLKGSLKVVSSVLLTFQALCLQDQNDNVCWMSFVEYVHGFLQDPFAGEADIMTTIGDVIRCAPTFSKGILLDILPSETVSALQQELEEAEDPEDFSGILPAECSEEEQRCVELGNALAEDVGCCFVGLMGSLQAYFAVSLSPEWEVAGELVLPIGQGTFCGGDSIDVCPEAVPYVEISKDASSGSKLLQEGIPPIVFLGPPQPTGGASRAATTIGALALASLASFLTAVFL